MKPLYHLAFVVGCIGLVNCGGLPLEHSSKDIDVDVDTDASSNDAGVDVDIPDANYEVNTDPCSAVCGCPGSCGVNAIKGTLGGAGSNLGHVER